METAKRIKRKLESENRNFFESSTKRDEAPKVKRSDRDIINRRAKVLREFIQGHRLLSSARLTVEVQTPNRGIIYRGARRNLWGRFTDKVIKFNNSMLRNAFNENSRVKKVFKV